MTEKLEWPESRNDQESQNDQENQNDQEIRKDRNDRFANILMEQSTLRKRQYGSKRTVNKGKNHISRTFSRNAYSHRDATVRQYIGAL